jgi:hypothetical protein
MKYLIVFLLSLVVLFGLFVVLMETDYVSKKNIVGYYIYGDVEEEKEVAPSITEETMDVMPINDNRVSEIDVNVSSGASEVFHVKENKFKQSQAEAVCKAYNSKVATLTQLEEAYQKGADWCSYGWTENGGAYFPTQKETYLKLQNFPKRKTECGVPGINGGMFSNTEVLFGVNCYGPKPAPKKTDVVKDDLLDPIELEAERIRAQAKNIEIAPFSKTKWSAYQL